MRPATNIASEVVANATARTESRARAGADRSVDAPSTRAAEPPPAQQPAKASVKVSVDTARLTYDRESRRVYVEIIDPQTGDVLQRLPPESAIEQLQQLNKGQPGALLDDIA